MSNAHDQRALGVDDEDVSHAALQADHWTQPLTGAELGPVATASGPSATTRISWLMPPKESGFASVAAPWVLRAIIAEPVVLAWRRDHAAQARRRRSTSRDPETVDELSEAIARAFDEEGGTEAVQAVAAAAATAHARDLARRDPGRSIARKLPNGLRIRAPVSEIVARSPVVTLTYPAGDDVASLAVLRDACLGQLATIADALAERYLIPASEIVFCILTGQLPRIPPIRLGMRFRRFDVDGMPVTATSRLVLDVDPQLEPGELARMFAQWKRVAGVKAAPSSSRLVPLATELLGKLSLAPAEQRDRANTHPSEMLGVGSRSWWLIPAVPWARLARETKCDPHLIRARAAAVVHLLLPLDAPRAPRWLARDA